MPDKEKAIERLKAIRNKLLKESHSLKKVYTNGVLDFYNETIKTIIEKPTIT